MKTSIACVVSFATCLAAQANTIVLWDFDYPPNGDTNVLTGTWAPAIGSGNLTNIGGTTNYFNTPANGGATATSDPKTNDNSALRLGVFPAASSANKTAGIQLFASTAGYENIQVAWDQENSATASHYWRAQYTRDHGASWTDFILVPSPGDVSWQKQLVADFRTVPGVDNNPGFGLRLVSEFESTATGSGTAGYDANSSSSTYGVNGTLWVDMVRVSGTPASGNSTPPVFPTIAVLTYNLGGGNFDDTAANWSTNSITNQAVGSIVRGLQPDIIGFQEYSVLNTWQLTNFVKAYLPGYFMATNSTTAGGPPNVILSRFPIARSRSWLARTDLTAFGFDGVFTRDLFEAQVVVPWLPQPLHVFDVHLKAFNDATNGPRRAAEARCVSNWLVTTYLTGPFKNDPYLLMGDMNEDIFRPRSYEQGAIGTLISTPTGLRLTTPVNPITGSETTWDSGSPTIRFDYVFPSGSLFSNYVSASSLVFRSDKYDALHPLPPGVSSGATLLATDHLPVMAVFNNPYSPFAILSATSTNSLLTLRWQSQINARYRIEHSTNFVDWTVQASNLLATATNNSWSTARNGDVRCYRVMRQP
jgi:endonuclease/exonuclease/phosphatase family metal-dependent hydrolase